MLSNSLCALRRMFPQVVTGDVMGTWQQQVRRHEPLDWTAVRAAELSYNSRQQHASTGCWGCERQFWRRVQLRRRWRQWQLVSGQQWFLSAS